MRAGWAVVALCLSTVGAAAGELQPLPDYFQQTWDLVASAPAATLPAPAAPAAKPAPRDVKAAVAELPPVMLAGIPTPPQRPVVTPGATAYASLGPADNAARVDDLGPTTPQPEVAAEPAAAIPLPVPRPRWIDQQAEADKEAPQEQANAVPDEQPAARAAPSPSPKPSAGRDHMVIMPAAPAPVPGTKVAMLGGLPGAGMAINSLARMQPLAPIARGSCSVAKPYELTALGPNGRTRLTPAATVDSDMIDGLVKWEAALQGAAKAYLGEPIAVLRVAASYDCRTMNHRRRARLSEHARANAIDISEFITVSGKSITVRRDFHDRGRDGSFLKQVHANTCDVFQVVLGPGSDGMHEDHFHMDLGRWKACR